MKYLYSLLTFAFFLTPFIASSQVIYQKTYGGNDIKVFTDICASSTNEIVAGGYWTPSSMITPMQPFLTKIDQSGNVMWSKEYASTGVGRAASVTETSDGGYLAAGIVDTVLGTGGTQDGYVMKVDGNGDVVWMTIVGTSGEHEEFTRVYEAPNGEVIALGISTVQMTFDEYYWFVKMSATGAVINSFVYFPSANSDPQALAFHPDGGYVIGGLGRVNAIDEAVLFKISDVGVLEWYKSYGTFARTEVITDLVLLSDKSVVFTGVSLDSDRDVMIGKTDSLGVLDWIKYYGGADHEMAYRILEHSSSGFVVSGWTEGLGGNSGPMLFKTDDNGDIVWTHVYSDGMPSGSIGLVQLTNNGYALGGTILPTQGTAIGSVTQVNSDGEGCNYATVALPALTETTVEDAPVVWASTGPSAVASYSPTVSAVTLPDSTDCSTLSIAEFENNSQIEIYPNPVSEGFEFAINSDKLINETMDVEIFDMMGRTVYQNQSNTNKMNVSTEGWSPGVYLISVKIDLQVQTKRIVVN